LRKRNQKFKFDSVIWTQEGALYCARFCRHSFPPPQEYDVASVVLATSGNTSSGVEAKEALKKIFKTNVKQAHDYLGHLSKDTTRMMAKYLGMILSRGSSPVCKSCAIAKAKQSNIPKETSGENKATEFNG
jgi:hypothetical protein